MDTDSGDSAPHVVILGAGFAGLACARALGNSGVAVTIIDRKNFHLFVPLLYQVATAALSPANIASPVRKLVRRCRNTEVVLGDATGIDTQSREVLVKDGSPVPYDRLVLAAGSTYNYFGHDEWADVAPGPKTLEDARDIRTRLLSSFELAERMEPGPARRALLTYLVVGGGPTGVEMAGSLAELAEHTLTRDYRRLDLSEVSIQLVEAGPRLLAGFPEDLASYAQRSLQRLGVTVRTGAMVEDIDAEGATVAGDRVPARTVVWAAGVQASPAAGWLDVETDKMGRLVVGPDFSVPGHADIHAIGDIAAVTGEDGKPLPALAQVAKQQGAHLGKALAAALNTGQAIPAFRYRDRGNAAIVGRRSAIFDFGRFRLKGGVAWLMWALVHIYLLSGFENRILVGLQWLWRYLTYERGARLIMGDIPSAPSGSDDRQRIRAKRAMAGED